MEQKVYSEEQDLIGTLPSFFYHKMCNSVDIIRTSRKVTHHLGPARNMQGSYNFMSLITGKKIVRHKLTEMPMTESVMRQINKWAKRECSEWTDVL